MDAIRKLLILSALGAMLWSLNAPADSMGGLNDSVFGSGMTYVPPADLTGWFFTSDAPPAFPVAPDPSQPWTSAANIATLDYWLSLVTDLGDGPATLDPLHTSGMTDAPTVQALDYAGAQNSGAPEPAAAVLLTMGLAAICTVAVVRTRRLRRYS